VLRPGLKQKTLFSFLRKAKISENSLAFREISYRESFRENFRFRNVFAKRFIFRESFRKLFFAKSEKNVRESTNTNIFFSTRAKPVISCQRPLKRDEQK
jgi:hypothetical protein